MILRRVIDRLRAHEWTGVVIELVIVVLGVFIGLQVSNWNEARKERSLEAVYLANIASDIRGDSAEMDEIIRVSTLRMAVLNRLLWQDPARPMPAGFASARGIIKVEPAPAYADNDPNSPGIALFILSTLDGNRSAYDTVINTGGIGLIRDTRTLRKIQDYYAAVDKVLHFEVGLEQNRDKLIDVERRLGISPADPMSVDALVTALAADPEFRATAENYWLYTNRHLKLMRELQQQATALADSLQGRSAP